VLKSHTPNYYELSLKGENTTTFIQ